jgi:hypothetical protein
MRTVALGGGARSACGGRADALSDSPACYRAPRSLAARLRSEHFHARKQRLGTRTTGKASRAAWHVAAVQPWRGAVPLVYARRVESDSARAPKPPRKRESAWTAGRVAITTALITGISAIAAGASASWIAKVSKDREIAVEEKKLEFENQRDARKVELENQRDDRRVEGEYFQKATDPNLSPGQRQRVFRFLQVALKGKPLETWATTELKLAQDDIKTAEEQQRKLDELARQLSHVRAKSGTQVEQIKDLELRARVTAALGNPSGDTLCLSRCSQQRLECLVDFGSARNMRFRCA